MKPIPHLRWYIAALLCLASELNYMDRQALSVLAVTIQKELGMSTVDYSRITFAFLTSYTIMYAVSGRIVDVLGTKRSFSIFVSAWSVANMLHALARSALQLAFFRFLLGAAEPGNFPAGVRAVAEWFPMKERALAVGIFNAGTALGSSLAAPVVAFIALKWGWQMAFVVTGAIGFFWVIGWAIFYYLPEHHPRLSEAERQLILQGRESGSQEKPPPIGALLRMPAAWGCILARILTDPISYFLNFWIPQYLEKERGFNLADVGKYAWIPFVALTLGNICSGAIPRFLIARGWSLNKARKTTMLVVSVALPVCYLSVTQVGTPAMALAMITACMFGHAAWGNVILPAEVFPQRAVGSVTGFGGALGALVGAISQLTIGYVVQGMGFAPIFAACSAAYLLAFAGVHFLIGELGVERKV
jgi:ACS family hexuronate transporter-like MFS transporter